MKVHVTACQNKLKIKKKTFSHPHPLPFPPVLPLKSTYLWVSVPNIVVASLTIDSQSVGLYVEKSRISILSWKWNYTKKRRKREREIKLKNIQAYSMKLETAESPRAVYTPPFIENWPPEGISIHLKIRFLDHGYYLIPFLPSKHSFLPSFVPSLVVAVVQIRDGCVPATWFDVITQVRRHVGAPYACQIPPVDVEVVSISVYSIAFVFGEDAAFQKDLHVCSIFLR